MIQYDKDGATVFYIDANGNKVSANPLDGVKYSAMISVMDAQIAAATENNQNVNNYKTQLANAQVSIDAGRTADAPPKPLDHVVSDTGVSTYVPFNPPLPDLIPAPAAVGSTTGGFPVAPSVDTQAIMYAMITAIYRKLFPAGA